MTDFHKGLLAVNDENLSKESSSLAAIATLNKSWI